MAYVPMQIYFQAVLQYLLIVQVDLCIEMYDVGLLYFD